MCIAIFLEINQAREVFLVPCFKNVLIEKSESLDVFISNAFSF